MAKNAHQAPWDRVLTDSPEEMATPEWFAEVFRGGDQRQNERALGALQIRSLGESVRATAESAKATAAMREVGERAIEVARQANKLFAVGIVLTVVLAGSAVFNAWLAGRAAGVW